MLLRPIKSKNNTLHLLFKKIFRIFNFKPSEFSGRLLSAADFIYKENMRLIMV